MNSFKKLFFSVFFLFLFCSISSNANDNLYKVPVPENQYFFIQSMNNVGADRGGYWDISGNPKNFKRGKTQNIQVWHHSNSPDRLYKFVKTSGDYYKIVPKHGNNAAVRCDPRKKGNGANIFLDNNNASHTEFRFEYTGNGLWRIFARDGRIICLGGRSSKNGSNVHLWTNHVAEGTLWAFITEKERRMFKPEGSSIAYNSVIPSNLPGENSKKFVKELDKTYNEIVAMNDRLNQIQKKVSNGNSTLREAKSLTNRTKNVIKNCGDTKEMVSTFNAIPFLGTVTRNASRVLDKTSGMVGKISKSLKPVNTAGDGFRKLNLASLRIGGDIDLLKSNLATAKKQYLEAADKVAKSNDPQAIQNFESKTSIAMASLASLKGNMGEVTKSLNLIDKVSGGIANLKKMMSKVDDGVKKAEKIVTKIGKGSRKVDGVLNKKFKKDIKLGIGKFSKKIKIRISVKDILTGKGAFKKLGKYVKKAKKWAQNKVKGLTKGLKAKAMDKIPGASDMLAKINKIKQDLNSIKTKGKEYADFAGKINGDRRSLEKNLLECVKCAKASS